MRVGIGHGGSQSVGNGHEKVRQLSSNNPLGDEQIVHFDLGADHLATADEIDHMDEPWEAGHVEIVHAHGTLPDLSDAEIKPFTDPRQLPGL